MSTETPIKNIYQRINAVMQEVEYVKKDARVQGYAAVTHDQVTSVLRKSMVTHGIVMRVQQVTGNIIVPRGDGSKMHLYDGSYQIDFVNIDNPDDFLQTTVEAHAADNGDKAPGKCMSYAVKYAMLKTFSLETGENEESRAEFAERTTTVNAEQMNELAEYCITTNDQGQTCWTPLGAKLGQAYQINALHELPASKYDDALTRCKNLAAKMEAQNDNP